jgi:hypothetical protein
MSMPFGNREKVAVLTIACLVSIGAMHYFVFMDQAKKYKQSLDDYTITKNQYGQSVAPDMKTDIAKMLANNQAMKVQLVDMAKKLSLDVDPVFFLQGPDKVPQLQARFLKLVYDLLDRRRARRGVDLAFFDWNPAPQQLGPQGDGLGWDIPQDLPTNLNIWDEIRRLKLAAREMALVDNPFTRQQRQVDYNRALANIGLNPNRIALDMTNRKQHLVNLGFSPPMLMMPPGGAVGPGMGMGMNPNMAAMPVRPPQTVAVHGELMPLIKKLAHARLIMERKQRDPRGGTEIIDEKELWDLLEIELPDDPEYLFLAIKQLEFLLKLIDLADKERVQKITTVELIPFRRLESLDMPDPINPAASVTRIVSGIHSDQMYAPMSYMRGPTGGYAITRRVPGKIYPTPPPTPKVGAFTTPAPTPGLRSPSAPGAAAGLAWDPSMPTPTPLPQSNSGGIPIWLGDATPIQIGFTSSWDTTLKYLYRISHNYNTFEPDSARIQMDPQGGGRVLTVVTLVPYARAFGLDSFYMSASSPVAPARPVAATSAPPPIPAASTAPPGPGAPTPPRASPVAPVAPPVRPTAQPGAVPATPMATRPAASPALRPTPGAVRPTAAPVRPTPGQPTPRLGGGVTP